MNFKEFIKETNLKEGARFNLKNSSFNMDYKKKEIPVDEFIKNIDKYVIDIDEKQKKDLINTINSWEADELIYYSDSEIIPLWR